MTVTDHTPVVLENGDRLTREEFHRRYCARPDIKKAELIEGVVYVASPVRLLQHGLPHLMLGGWLAVYLARTPGAVGGDNVTLRLAGDNELQPDLLLFWEPPRGAGARLTEAGFVEGPPELVVEVASSTASYDLHDKKAAYERAGVREYVVWRVLDEAIDWFRLSEGRYARVEPDARGVIESATFPGLRLSVPKLLAGDLAGVLAELEAPSR